MKRNVSTVLVAAMLTSTFGFAASAGDQKKVSLSEAWKICKEEVDKAIPKSADHATQRYARGGACMKKFGHQL